MNDIMGMLSNLFAGQGGRGMLNMSPEQQRMFMGMGQGLLQASAPSRMPVPFTQALGMGFEQAQENEAAYTEQQLRRAGIEAQMANANKKRYEKIGNKIVDPDTGKVVYDAGPDQMTPYQREHLKLMRDRMGAGGAPSGSPDATAPAAPPPGMGKPPSGYRWREDGSLEPIPGGPGEKLSPEAAAKTAQVDNALTTIPEIRRLMVDQSLDPVSFYAEAGDTGQGRRLVKQAVEAYLRATSGAAVPETEVDRALRLYEPTPFDKKPTRQRKVDQLENFLKGTGANIKKGRSADSSPPADDDLSAMSDDELLQALGQ